MELMDFSSGLMLVPPNPVCHWPFSIPPENIRKLEVFRYCQGVFYSIVDNIQKLMLSFETKLLKDSNC